VIRRALRADGGAWASSPDGVSAAWRLRGGGGAFDLRTEIEGVGAVPPGGPPPAAALAATLLPAMRRRRALRLPGPCDSRLAAALPRLQATVASFFPWLCAVPVRFDPGPAAAGTDAAAGTGVFLSLGVDSFFSLVRHREQVDHLVLVHGFDIPLESTGLWARARDAAADVARGMDKRLLCVRTNVRAWLDRHVPWDEGHGAAMAHVAHVLEPWLGRVYVASSHHEDVLFPYGSHPDLDPLWSTEALDLVHDGCDTRRIDKVRALAEEPLALEHLRVCWQNPGGAYNCGRCRKCLLVMLALDAVGLLSRCRTLPHEIHPQDVDAVDVWSESGLLYMEENRDAYRGHDADPALLAAVERAIASERRRLGR